MLNFALKRIGYINHVVDDASIRPTWRNVMLKYIKHIPNVDKEDT